ncbi:hypothetical protein ERO13_D10G218300v2 [Gossypium hirsutum]|uniref:Probable membrane-associated kinase regulator 4 n=1 Tax=Gossypium hirsutum TaxID=3635 RepID=A0A1U8LXD5_GOSHI|nr:probable membrane-associated kinase regulator 4 [Gossypium hirsutum]KAG4127487.1 hypothetical protein ERO13_D10G218300v2 [Gossypium hirsutum]
MSFIDNEEDDEYIDMEITSFSNYFTNSRNSREFEFQMSSISIEKEPTSSPADELFYNGKLLPLHLPPQLLQFSGSGSGYGDFKNGVVEELYGTPLTTTVTTPTSTSTPFESCNISPCDSCYVSGELNPDEYSSTSLFYEYSTETEVSRCFDENPKKSWTKKLKLSSKLKASRAYLKALFGKSGCTDESSDAAKDGNQTTVSKPKRRNNADKGKLVDNSDGNGNSNRHRRSFSTTATKGYSLTNKSSTSSPSSSSSSSNSNGSNGFPYLQFLKRSSSVNTEIENPIQGAIAHCKRSQSQKMMASTKIVGEVGYYSLTASNIPVFEEQDRPDHCRG